MDKKDDAAKPVTSDVAVERLWQPAEISAIFSRMDAIGRWSGDRMFEQITGIDLDREAKKQ